MPLQANLSVRPVRNGSRWPDDTGDTDGTVSGALVLVAAAADAGPASTSP